MMSCSPQMAKTCVNLTSNSVETQGVLGPPNRSLCAAACLTGGQHHEPGGHGHRGSLESRDTLEAATLGTEEPAHPGRLVACCEGHTQELGPVSMRLGDDLPYPSKGPGAPRGKVMYSSHTGAGQSYLGPSGPGTLHRKQGGPPPQPHNRRCSQRRATQISLH